MELGQIIQFGASKMTLYNVMCWIMCCEKESREFWSWNQEYYWVLTHGHTHTHTHTHMDTNPLQ